MQTKEIASLLNCDNRRLCERLKYYKKQGVFKPEGTVVKGKTDYTMKDLDSIKELEVLTKSGISCGNIKKIQAGECSLDYIIADTITSLNNQIERAKSSIALLQMMSDDNVQFDSFPADKYWSYVSQKEDTGEVFMDIDYEYDSIKFLRSIVCPYCGVQNEVDFEDYIFNQCSDENGMGPDIVYSFDSEDGFECCECRKPIRLHGWIREYPIGAFHSEEIIIAKCSEEDE